MSNSNNDDFLEQRSDYGVRKFITYLLNNPTERDKFMNLSKGKQKEDYIRTWLQNNPDFVIIDDDIETLGELDDEDFILINIKRPPGSHMNVEFTVLVI